MQFTGDLRIATAVAIKKYGMFLLTTYSVGNDMAYAYRWAGQGYEAENQRPKIGVKYIINMRAMNKYIKYGLPCIAMAQGEYTGDYPSGTKLVPRGYISVYSPKASVWFVVSQPLSVDIDGEMVPLISEQEVAVV